jgi:hypothetical protein
MKKKLLSALGLCLFMVTIVGCVVRGPRVAPPPPRTVVRTARPGPNYIWVRGHWGWKSGRYVWVNGYWLKRKPGRTWVAGHWEKRGTRWVWVRGHWR